MDKKEFKCEKKLKEEVISYALELTTKICSDPDFNEGFRKATKKFEETLFSDSAVIIPFCDIPCAKINEENPTQYIIHSPPVKKDVYHEAIHVISALYRLITEDVLFKEVKHPAFEQARQHLYSWYKEYVERSKKFYWRYCIFPVLKFLNRINTFFNKNEKPYIDPFHFSVNIYQIEEYDEKTKKKALEWLEEIAAYRLTSYYGVNPFD